MATEHHNLVTAFTAIFTCIVTASGIALALYQYNLNRKSDRVIKRDELVTQLYAMDSAVLQDLAEGDALIARMMLSDTEGDVYRKIKGVADSGDGEKSEQAKATLAKAHIQYSRIGNLLESYLLLRDSGKLDATIVIAWNGYIKSYYNRSMAFREYMDRSFAADHQTWTDDYYKAFYPAEEYKARFPDPNSSK